MRVLAGAGMAAADRAIYDADLSVLADVIARNREIAGVHYPKDSEGGARLAELLDTQIFTTTVDSTGTTIYAVKMFNDAITDAAGEWS